MSRPTERGRRGSPSPRRGPGAAPPGCAGLPAARCREFRATAAGVLIGFFLAACSAGRSSAAVPAGDPPPDLPEAVHIKTPTDSFTHEWYVVLRGNRIWFRPNAETTGRREPWRLLPPDGLAHHRRHRDGDVPVFREITADGDNLVVVSADGLVQYMKFSDLGWIDHWGIPPFGQPLFVRFEHRGLAMSHRGPLAAFFEDIDGNRHAIWAGVTTLYALGADGLSVRYADPWLPADFNRGVCLPRRGRFVAAALSASASTLFVVNEAGEMFTRLADYDTMGDNPILSYSYKREFRHGRSVRTLPPEDWLEQPPVPGKITRRITILQTGAGNGGRELRVEGLGGAGAAGTWRKPIRGAAWEFVGTGAAPTGPFLANAANPEAPVPVERLLGPDRDRDYAGILASPRVDVDVAVELRAFNADCPPATVRLTSGGASLEVALYWRSPDRSPGGEVTAAWGMLAIPQGGSLAGPLRTAVEQMFGEEESLVEVDLGIDGDTVTLKGDAPGLFRRLRMVFRGTKAATHRR